MEKVKGKFLNNKILIVLLRVVIGIVSVLVFRKSFSETLDNHVEVEPETELTYYLNVNYDGVDKNGVTSNDTTVSQISSGYLLVEDKIPEGLAFTGFVTTEDNSIGAVKRSDGSVCPGKVVDDTGDVVGWNAGNTEYTYHGLHYNTLTRTVTFKVNKLLAGCELTVGIKTKTPTIDDPSTTEVEKRRDFYNFATAWENDLVVNSNTVHAFMGASDAVLYKVIYEYTGTVPPNAPSLPEASDYSENSKVLVAPNAKLEGYTFSGWTTADTTISNNSFTMPAQNVTLRGSFTPATVYQVSYQLEGDTPPGYVLPLTKKYSDGTIVDVDELEVGTVINGYRFLGWKTTDVIVSPDNNFEMPANNVLLVGEFEAAKYKVIYKFYDTVLPPNADSYLPVVKEYLPGTNVLVENIVSEPAGYKFLGWYKEKEFVMPEEDVVIYGEWMVQAGTFAPTITKEVVGSKNYYRFGDTINFKVKVTNTASYPIKDVVLKETKVGATFVAGANYTVESPTLVKIPVINAGATFEVNVQYKVLKTDTNKIVNTVELIGALADSNNILEEKEYKAEATANLESQIKICKNISGVVVPNTFQFNITGINNNYDTWVTLQNDECKTIYVAPETYKIMEVIPQEYDLVGVTGAITTNGSNLVVLQGTNYEITYTNQFKGKGFFHSSGRVVNQIKGGA